MAHTDPDPTADDLPGADDPRTDVEERDPLVRMAHPDLEGPTDERTVAEAVQDRVAAEVEAAPTTASVTFDRQRERVEVTTRTVQATAAVDDVDVRLTGGACVTRRTGDGDVVLVEGDDGDAVNVVRGLVETVDPGAFREERRTRERRRTERHPSLTVGERNPGLGGR